MKTKAILFISIFLFQTGIVYCQGKWTQKADYPGGDASYFGFGFVIGDKAFVSGSIASCFYEYNSELDIWTQKAQIPITGGYTAFLSPFAIGNSGYLINPMTNDVWQYNQPLDTWIQKNNFPGLSRYDAIAFSYNGKGYYGLGNDSNPQSDFWEYDPTNDSWSQLNDMPIGRSSATVFVIGNKAYIGTGLIAGNNFSNDFWEYNISADSWTRIADLPGSDRVRTVGFSIYDKGYVGTGLGFGYLNDFWQYNPVTDSWIQLDDFPGPKRQGAVSFEINNKGYITSGYDGSSMVIVYPDLWEYEPFGTGFNNIEEAKLLKIYPNPANNIIEISTPEPEFQVEVLNIFGQVLLKENNRRKIYINNFAAGTYVVKVTTEEKSWQQRIIVY
jgi:hypothetical protein